MKKEFPQLLIALTFTLSHFFAFSQNVGLNILTPLGKLHVKGSEDVSQLIIEANSTQSNSKPLIRLRKSNGMNLLSITSDDSTNCFVGLKAGLSNNASALAFNNTFIGNQAGFLNATGHDNTALGSQALYSNTRFSQNTAIGKGALGTQSYDPGFDVSSGNVAVGNAALFTNQPTSAANGVANSAVGWSALRFNTTGFNNSAFGFSSLYSNTTASRNTAIGTGAMYSNTTAGQNTAVGFNALYVQSYSPGSSWTSANVAIGNEALYANQPTSTVNGINNIAIGNYSLGGNTTGFNNIAIGVSAMSSHTTGSANTACGRLALVNCVTGIENTAVGYNSGTAAGSSGAINTVSVGNNGYLNGASNQAFIGNLSTNWTGGNTTWFTYASDGRVKKNVKEDVKGLEFISRLRPVTYNLDIKSMRIITGNEETSDYPEKYDVEKIKQSGFIAQEVEQAAFQSGYSFSGITVPRNENELYTVSYAQFVVPLVKAVQELNAELKTQGETLNSEISRLNVENEALSLRLEKIEASLNTKNPD